jgi:hypothetical protein
MISEIKTIFNFKDNTIKTKDDFLYYRTSLENNTNLGFDNQEFVPDCESDDDDYNMENNENINYEENNENINYKKNNENDVDYDIKF